MKQTLWSVVFIISSIVVGAVTYTLTLAVDSAPVIIMLFIMAIATYSDPRIPTYYYFLLVAWFCAVVGTAFLLFGPTEPALLIELIGLTFGGTALTLSGRAAHMKTSLTN